MQIPTAKQSRRIFFRKGRGIIHHRDSVSGKGNIGLSDCYGPGFAVRGSLNATEFFPRNSPKVCYKDCGQSEDIYRKSLWEISCKMEIMGGRILFSFWGVAERINPPEEPVAGPCREDPLSYRFNFFNGIKRIRVEILDDANDMGKVLSLDNSKDHLHITGAALSINAGDTVIMGPEILHKVRGIIFGYDMNTGEAK